MRGDFARSTGLLLACALVSGGCARSQRGSVQESGNSTDALDGGAEASESERDAPRSTESAPTEFEPVVDPPDSGPSDAAVAVASDLGGYWAVAWNIGGCIDYADYFWFGPPDVFERVRVDNNACGPQGTFRSAGSYILEGRDLQLFTSAQGGGGRHERAGVAFLGQGADALVYWGAYLPVDDRTWRAAVMDRYTGSDGSTSVETSTVLELRFDTPLPVDGDGVCNLEVTMVASRFRREPSIDERDVELRVALPCVFESAPERQHIMYDDSLWSWSEHLQSNSAYTAAPDWLKQRFGQRFFRDMWLTRSDPSYLYHGTPWQRVDDTTPGL